MIRNLDRADRNFLEKLARLLQINPLRHIKQINQAITGIDLGLMSVLVSSAGCKSGNAKPF